MDLRIRVLILALLSNQPACECYNVFQTDISYSYKIDAVVELVPDVEKKKESDAITQWKFNGNLKIERINENLVAVQMEVKDDENQLDALKHPFKIRLPVTHRDSPPIFLHHHHKFLEFNSNEAIWSANIKRAIAALFQIEGSAESGAFVSQEFSLYGLCPMEYYVNQSSSDLQISKIYDMDLCTFPGGIFTIRSNIPINYCEPDNKARAHAVMSRLGDYKLSKLNNSQYLLKSIRAESKSNVQSSESYYPQFIFTKIFIDFDSQEELTDENRISFNASEKVFLTDFTYALSSEATGGRHGVTSDEIVSVVAKMLVEVAENLEHNELRFDEPYMELISQIIRLIETMNFESLKKLYNQIDIGTSYIQETSRNIFLEILPRVGTVSSVLLAKDLVINKHVRPTTAVQILTALPFFISELSSELIKECEDFLHVGIDRPDVKHSAVLSYSTMIYKAYNGGVISSDHFEKYVKIIFDLLLNSFDYEPQMLYLEAMGNLQLGNVPNYLFPIIQANYSQNTDFRFLAIFATMPTAHKRPIEVYETYWPIFHSHSNPLQLRIAAFNMLLVSARTPGRLLGIFNVIKNENCPHMINFYRTTILSISESTYSCLSHLKRLVLYMRRHLPPAPPKKYWITGNYIFDYKDRKFQIGSMLQVLLIGDLNKDLPLIAFFKFDTEAMGRFTGQVGLYIKARGLSDLVADKISSINVQTLKTEELLKILKLMKMEPIQSTPLHLELIVQYEGKTILSYYMNQTTFNHLSEGDIINRINTVLRTDSHINMQIVRRPYYIKHAFATLIGTPVQILIENTMIASIRGLTTQNAAEGKITRRNEIDLRYSSYAVAKILSYNPIEDIEYSTIREQGFLSYLPLNNEITLNLAEKSISLAFYRKEPITSGLALKSRTRNFYGYVDPLKSKNGVPTNKFNIEDIGINFLIEHNAESSKEYLAFLLESDVATSAKVFTKTPYSIVQNILTLVSMIQLTSIHIGRDKHLTLQLTNEPKSKLEAVFKWDYENERDENVLKIDCNLFHILNYDDELPKHLHRWEFSTKYSSFKNHKSSKAVMSLVRKTKSDEKWKLCISSTFDSMVNFKEPFLFTSKILFGNYDDATQKCPTEGSEINLLLSIGSSKHVNGNYKRILVEDEKRCTKDIVKFSPVPEFENCNRTQFNDLLSVTDVGLKMDFKEMPEIFYKISKRVNHMLLAFMPNILNENLNVSNHVDFKIKLPSNDDDEIIVDFNDNVANLPFNYRLAHGDCDQILLDYNFISTCSLYRDSLSTLFGEHATISRNDDDEVLLMGECSDTPRIAVYVEYKNNSSEFSKVKIFVGGHHIEIKGDSRPIVYHENTQHDLTNNSFEFPAFEKDLRASLIDDSIIEIYNDLIKAKVLYNMENLISISLPTFMKGKACGLCSDYRQNNC